MSQKKTTDDKVQDRVANYRARSGRQGFQRMETTVPEEDARLIKDLAKILRENNEQAEKLRQAIRQLIPNEQLKTGKELLQFFRESPLADDSEIEFERDQSTGRSAKFNR